MINELTRQYQSMLEARRRTYDQVQGLVGDEAAEQMERADAEVEHALWVLSRAWAGLPW
jgi:DNA-binding ferritin-like protein